MIPAICQPPIPHNPPDRLRDGADSARTCRCQGWTRGRLPAGPGSAHGYETGRRRFGRSLPHRIRLLGVAAVVRSAANGWITELYVEPAHHFTYSGFWWVQPWPGWGMYLHFALMGLAAAGVAAGYRYRLSIVAFFLLFTYVELIDKTTYLNHYYWVSLVSLLMIFMPLGRTWSLDARRGTAGTRRTIPAWVIWGAQDTAGGGLHLRGDCQAQPRLAAGGPATSHLAVQQRRSVAGRAPAEGDVGCLRHELGLRRVRPDACDLAALGSLTAPGLRAGDRIPRPYLAPVPDRYFPRG